MRRAIYPGSFDPITNGHLDIIKRAKKVFEEVIIVVSVNPEKKELFSGEERVELIRRAIGTADNVKVECFTGLLINFMKEKNATVIVKGLRTVADFEYEFQMSLMNNKLDPNIETVFMMTNSQYSYVSSSSVKQVAVFGGCLKGLVPECTIPDIMAKITKK